MRASTQKASYYAHAIVITLILKFSEKLNFLIAEDNVAPVVITSSTKM